MPGVHPGILMSHATQVNPYELQWCPSTTALVGTLIATNQTIILGIRCRRWTCTYCRTPNEILLKERVASGTPNKMLTLTIRRDSQLTPKQTHEKHRPAISRLYHLIRRANGPLEAATFLELHKSGYPHWHALVRSDYIPIDLIREKWEQLTGSYIVDLRRIRDAEVSRRYVSKYVVKQLDQQIFHRLGRVVCFTRHYAPPVVPKAPTAYQWSRDKRHPIEIQESSYRDWTAEWSGRTCILSPPPSKPF